MHTIATRQQASREEIVMEIMATAEAANKKLREGNDLLCSIWLLARGLNSGHKETASVIETDAA